MYLSPSNFCSFFACCLCCSPLSNQVFFFLFRSLRRVALPPPRPPPHTLRTFYYPLFGRQERRRPSSETKLKKNKAYALVICFSCMRGEYHCIKSRCQARDSIRLSARTNERSTVGREYPTPGDQTCSQTLAWYVLNKYLSYLSMQVSGGWTGK